MADENSWRTPAFRQSVVAKIDEAIRQSGMNTSRNSLEMENHVFQKAKNKEEYLGFVARLILHVREMKSETISEDCLKSLMEKVLSRKPPKLIKVLSKVNTSKLKDNQQTVTGNIHDHLLSHITD